VSAKDVRLEQVARKAIVRGVEVLANTVAVTLGPRGRHVVLERPYGPPLLTKDGVTVAKEISLPDRFENLGVQVVKEAALRTGEEAGDGTTTAVVLARAMIREGMKFLAVGIDAMGIKRGMELAASAACAELEKLSQPCTGHAVSQVATVAANGDSAVGELIASAFNKVGAKGVITVEDGESLADALEVRQGMQFDQGYLSPYFLKGTAQKVVLENPRILLHEDRISTLRDLLPLLEAAAKASSPLLIVAADVEGEALTALAVNAKRGVLEVCAVKPPEFGDERRASMADLAVLIGGSVISPETGSSLKNTPLEGLGRARRVEVTDRRTIIIDGAGERARIDDRVRELEQALDDARIDSDRERLHTRIAKLSGGVAVIKAGAHTELELREKKDRIDDALRATRAAVEEGVVPGGGVALLRVKQALKGLAAATEAHQAGIDILLRALDEPLKQIAANAGAEPLIVAAKVLAGAGDFGYDASTGTYAQLLQAGIVDPKKVARVALQNATSVAGMMLTTDCMVAELLEEPLAVTADDA
jgi:chaperonin GroEL